MKKKILKYLPDQGRFKRTEKGVTYTLQEKGGLLATITSDKSGYTYLVSSQMKVLIPRKGKKPW